MSLHRACCCGCPATVEVIISGVDVGKCGCTPVGGSSTIITDLIADGTYTLDYMRERTEGGRQICDYEYCADFGSTVFREEFYSGSTVCAGTPSVRTRTKIAVTVELFKENGKIKRLGLVLKQNCFDGFGFAAFDTGGTAFPGLDRATSHPNILTCAYEIASSTGTGIVS